MPPPVFKSNVALKESLRELMENHPISDELLMTNKWKNKLVEKIVGAQEKRKLSPDALSEDDIQLLSRYSFWSRQGRNRKIQYLLERPTAKAMLTDSVFLISFEESLELIKRAHTQTNHGDLNTIENYIHEESEKRKFKKRYCRYSVALFFVLEVCLICKNKYNISIPELYISPKKSLNEACHATVSVDILELLPDNLFKYLLIVQYQETNYIQLRPLTSTEGPEIFSVLHQLFMDLIVPRKVLTRSVNFNIFSKHILRLSSLLNTNIVLRANDATVDLKPRIKTRTLMWLKREVGTSWAIGCNFVQWEMNNIADIDGTIPYSKMFNAKALHNCPQNIDVNEFWRNDTVMDTDVNLPSTVPKYDQLESTNTFPIETPNSNALLIKQDNNLIENIETNDEFGATIHIPEDDSLVDDNFDIEHFIIEEENFTQNDEDIENDTVTNVTGTTIIKMEDDDNEMIIPDIQPKNIESFDLVETKTEKISFIEDIIPETKHIQADNSVKAAETTYSDPSDHICIECKKTIQTKVYICYKCGGKIHLFCGSQSRDEVTFTIVSFCASCKNSL